MLVTLVVFSFFFFRATNSNNNNRKAIFIHTADFGECINLGSDDKILSIFIDNYRIPKLSNEYISIFWIYIDSRYRVTSPNHKFKHFTMKIYASKCISLKILEFPIAIPWIRKSGTQNLLMHALIRTRATNHCFKQTNKYSGLPNSIQVISHLNLF